jgi:hypothetical protein
MQPTGVLSRRRETRRNAEGEEQRMKLTKETAKTGVKILVSGYIYRIQKLNEFGCEASLLNGECSHQLFDTEYHFYEIIE